MPLRIASALDEPWLFDLQKDPDELTNRFLDPAYREVIRHLSRRLAAYGTRYKDPYTQIPAVKADLAWAIEGTGAYKPPTRKPPPGTTPKKRPKRRAKKRAK